MYIIKWKIHRYSEKCVFPNGKHEVQFKIDTFIWYFDLSEWMDNVCILKRKIMRNSIHNEAVQRLLLLLIFLWFQLMFETILRAEVISSRAWSHLWPYAHGLGALRLLSTWTCWSLASRSPGVFQRNLLRSSSIHSPPLDTGPRSCLKQTAVPGAFFIYDFLSIPPYVIVCLRQQLCN